MGRRNDDRLSDLPTDVIHKIMSFLSPLEIARLRVLSKRLSLLWLCVPDLTLDSTHPDWLNHQDAFLTHARTTIRRRGRVDPTLWSLSPCFFTKAECDDEDWMAAPLLELGSDLAVSDLSIHVQNRYWPNIYYRVELYSPWLRSLKLTGISLPHREFLVMCPLLRHFHLHSCNGGQTMIRFSPAAKLIETVSVIKCRDIDSISVDQDSPAALLEFSFVGDQDYGKGPRVDVFNAASKESLKVLEMSWSGMVTGDWLREEVSKLVSLEKLGLRFCHALDRVFIGSPKLKHLVLECTKPRELAVEVAVPGLESLSVNFGWHQLKINIDACRSLRRVEIVGGVEEMRRMIETLLSNRSLESLTLGRVRFNESSLPSQRFHCNLTYAEIPAYICVAHGERSLPEFQTRLCDLFSFFGRCNTLTLAVGMGVDECIYPKKLREALNPPLMEVKELNVTNLCEPEDDRRMVKLVDSLLWLSPRLHTLTIIDDMSRTIFRIKFHRSSTQQGDFERKCCSSVQNKCWRHDLTEVVIENCERYCDRKRLHKYVVENVNVNVTVSFPRNVNKNKIRYLYEMEERDRIFI